MLLDSVQFNSPDRTLSREQATHQEREAKISLHCDELHRIKTIPILSMLFILEVIYAGWSTMKYRCLDLKRVESAPFFLTSCILQVYLGVMAIKDGLILISLSKKIGCISQRTLLFIHCIMQVIDVMALVSIAITVCMDYETETVPPEPEQQEQQGDDGSSELQTALDFYSICKMSVVFALILSFVKFCGLIYLMFFCVFSRRLIREQSDLL